MSREHQIWFFILLLGLHGLCCTMASEIPVGDLAGRGYSDWTLTGTAFRKGPVSGDLASKLDIENAPDGMVASSEIEGDEPVGTLTSPEFDISKRYISFNIGGGDYEHSTCLNLLIEGKVVRSATGWRSDRLAPCSWDVTQFQGRKGRVQLVDLASGDWGHLSVSHIVQTDQPERFPVFTGPLYQESLRPQFHFTARQWTMTKLNPREREEGWVNDLNGLIYYDGEFHLFAQRWAKCWLHAVSRDLVHWTELPPAFWEEKLDSGVQSGTCVVDYDNTSGLGREKTNPPMIAFWSRFDNRSQCLSYSLDHGRTWKLYEKNPLMEYPERDPKVFWYGPAKHWVMMLYGQNQYHVLTSTNLLNWKDENKPIHDSFECPDFFQLPLDGDHSNMKWVLIQGSGKYSVGSFDGTEFKEETDRYGCDIGDFYATQTWGNVETGDGRRIQAAWMRFSQFPDMPFNQEVTFPCELTLHSTAKGSRIFRQPIKEIASLHRGEDNWTNRVLKVNEVLPVEPSGRLFHIRAEVEIPEQARLVVNIRGVPLQLTRTGLDSGNRHGAAIEPIKTLEILVDRTSIETFVNRGEISATRFVLPKDNGIFLKAEGGPVTIRTLSVFPLNSAWPNGVSD
jgi:fructan beta-fructosidase